MKFLLFLLWLLEIKSMKKLEKSFSLRNFKCLYLKIKHTDPSIFFLLYTEYYMSKSVSHAVSTGDFYITPKVIGPQDDIGGGLMWYRF